MTAAYEAELQQWRAKRLAALVAPDGWLNLTDRVEIPGPGLWSVGSGPGNDLRLTVGPDCLGWVELAPDGSLGFRSLTSATQPFLGEDDSLPRVSGTAVEGLILERHEADGAVALRVRQIDHPARADFAGLRHFPTDPDWVIEARWIKLDHPVGKTIEMVSGSRETVSQTHVAVFTHGGREIALVPTHQKGDQPMFLIRDATSGVESYAASRFLLGDVLDGGHIRLDFNRLHNPPCAFTDLAICPLPPPENVLPFRIEAGELRP